jgi:hypothetical protein
MNYKQLVISQNPSAYISYDNGNNVPDIAVAGYASIATGLNPNYGYVNKAMGMRSKQIGQVGSGTYDYVRINGPGGTRKQHVYFEGWVYIPTGFTTSSQVNIWNAGSTINPNANSSYVLINGFRQVTWATSNGAGSGLTHFQNSIATIPFNTWTHVGVMYSAGAKTIYINGVVDSTSTAPVYALNGSYYDAINAGSSTFVDEVLLYAVDSAAGLPTPAQILARATFPMTKTKWWDPSTSSWLTSGDEQYWTGTQWISMQDMPYRYWNGSSWVTI